MRPATGFRGAYGSWNRYYKRALYATGMGTAERAKLPLAGCRQAWYELLGEYHASPPSEHAEDAQWSADLVTITGYVHLAEWRAHAGDLEEAHEALERVRYLWREVRERNGVRWFGDELLRFHDVMEPMVAWGTGAERGGVTPENVEEYRAEMARLLEAWTRVQGFEPKPRGPGRRLPSAMANEAKALGELWHAVRAGSYGQIPEAARAVKQGFLRLYMGSG
jgi:hypothetical protein